MELTDLALRSSPDSDPAHSGGRVCILLETYHPEIGGGETQGRLLAQGLSARGFEVVIVTRRTRRGLPRREAIGGVPVRRVGPAGPGRLKKWGLLLTAVPTLIGLRRSYDALLVSGFRILGIPAVVVGKLLGKTSILKADSNGEMSGQYFAPGLAHWGVSPSFPPFRILLAARNAILKRADAFVPLSSEIADEIAANGVEPAKIVPIPNCVDTGRFRPIGGGEKRRLRLDLGFPPDDAVVVFVGRLVRYKGLPLLLRVWREIARERPAARLILVGAGGMDLHNCEQELRGYAAANGMQESVVFTGFVGDVHRYLQAADLFVFPTENEAFGIALIEAMACGLPAVATWTGGIKDIATHEADALLVEPGAHDPLQGAIERVLGDPALAARLGAAARQTVIRRFSLEAVVSRYLELLSRLLSGHSKLAEQKRA